MIPASFDYVAPTSLVQALEALRDGPGPERAGFDALQERLMNRGIERLMRPAELPDVPEE